MEKDILEQLYRIHTKAVYLYLYTLCHNHDLAEDLMQETFLRALCSLEIARSELLPWLLTVARNLYLDTWRREKRLEKEIERRKMETVTGEGILEMMIQKERNQNLYQAIQKLKDIEREAVVLYYFAGISQEEIGSILNLSYGNTRVILYRAKKNLKKLLEGEEMMRE
ncbi:sigma-70 family RNA polymerase sigma factor [Lachnospiraceae bacterium WCA-9-b2]|uniref:Sigma-70 family RNA polymerase sigma factor n=1 Tax=Sporofaciens musculi TaxID=2681861 RepID=A0A7X3MLI9_9FIRM|nr:RNA polymerase sigma factor [Sporofaciens musculi]MXP78636.1 sigma-70 family RNA polymerase sigma factor [Sporofaciens musculi]